MHRKELQKLATLRLKEALALFSKKEYSGAYYLAGYVIECALKAVIAKPLKSMTLPDKELADRIYRGHDLKNLLRLARLEEKYENLATSDYQFQKQWMRLFSWKVEARYQITDREGARGLIEAASEILGWIKQFW